MIYQENDRKQDLDLVLRENRKTPPLESGDRLSRPEVYSPIEMPQVYTEVIDC